jgi:hypothetical protein
MQKGVKKSPFKVPLHTHIRPEYEKLIEGLVVDSGLTKVKIIDKIMAAYFPDADIKPKPKKS